MKIPEINLLAKAIMVMAFFLATTSNVFAMDEVEDSIEERQITCETIQICQELSAILQTQIDELESKGIENLTNEEFEQYAKLSDDLLMVKRSEIELNEEFIASENEKQVEQEELIAAENAKQEKMRLSQEQALAEIKARLLEE
jgi:hypothetical protein